MARKKNRNKGNNQSTDTTATNNTPNYSNTDIKDELGDVFDIYQRVDSHEGETDTQYIGGEGIMKFCEDLNIDPMDILVLIIMYKLGTKEQYKISRSEFCDGFRKSGVRNMQMIRDQVPKWRNQVLNNEDQFKELYMFAFEYSRDPTQKGMAIDIAVATWAMLLEGRYLTQWNNYMENKYKKTIQKDLWSLFYDFTRTVGDNLANYSEEQAWPIAVDEFVEMVKVA
jgi:DCN1-like protein 1/2